MERGESLAATQEFPHPFIYEVKLSRAQRIRGLVLGSVLVPLRVTMAVLFFLIIWPIARLRLAGLPEEERARPVTGWRRWLFHRIVLLLSRAVFFSMGFLWIKVKGRRADLKEAPVLVVAPHSSFLDMLVLCPTHLATVVSRSENTSLPAIGALLEFNQSVIVSRKDPESRKKAVTELIQRLTSKGYWPQMLMYPEGTTTNGRALIKFKPGGCHQAEQHPKPKTRVFLQSHRGQTLPSGFTECLVMAPKFVCLCKSSRRVEGAFLAGVPVQPVLLRYPNKLDTVRWTYEGASWKEAVWHTASQFYTKVTVEFLPVYNPSKEEKRDPNLYADNVQKLMAKALGVPATDYVMEGRFPVSKLGGLSLPLASPGRETLSLLRKNGLEARALEAALAKMIDGCLSGAQGSKASADELNSILSLNDRQTAVRICGLYSKDETVDLRQLYFSVSVLTDFTNFKDLLHSAFAMYDQEGKGSLNAEELSNLMGALLGVPQLSTSDLYAEAYNLGLVTEENLLRVLTTHPTYQRVISDFLQPEKSVSANGRPVNNNGLEDGVNGSLHHTKKFE